MKPQKMILSWMFQCLMSIQTFFHCPSLNNKQKYAFLIDWISSATAKGDLLMSLVSHKKSYLVCIELTNFRIFTQPIPIFFQNTKLRQPTEGRDSCLKINKYYVIFVNSTIRHILNSFSCEKPGTELKKKYVDLIKSNLLQYTINR